MLTGLFSKLLLAIIFGAGVGLEREGSGHAVGSIGGIRTYSIIALLGALAGVFFLKDFSSIALLLMGGFFVLLVLYYALSSNNTKQFGLTTELSVLATFIIGLLVVLEIIPLQIVVAIFVILMLILSLKSKTREFVAGVSRTELQSFISYAIIALVVLPILPDVAYRLNDIPVLPEIFKGLNIDLGRFNTLDLLNPRTIWMVVVLITGIDVFGYVLGRIVGNKKGFALTSFMAGFVSSTSATQSLAQKSRKPGFVSHLVGAAVLANLASFLQIFLLVGPLNPKWFLAIVPSILIMILTAGIFTMVFLNKKEPVKQEVEESPKAEKIFSIMPALKFAAILIVIKVVTKVCLILFGQSGFIISSVIASFAGLDAILVNLAEMAGTTITFKFAFITFLLVNATNLLSKTVYSYLQGTREFAFRFLLAAVAIMIAGSAWLFFI